jgi:CTP:molybdopterin cytidylyltransferase MocA
MGLTKALMRDSDGTAWVTRSARVLADGGCRPVFVVVGSAAHTVSELVPEPAHPVLAVDWAEGLGASLRAGLAGLAAGLAGDVRAGAVPVVAVLIGLVDTPGVSSAVVARLLPAAGPQVLARATYRGRPGHPVLIGCEHWAGVAAAAHGDVGARGYLAGRDDIRLIECADAGDGEDRDYPALRPAP